MIKLTPKQIQILSFIGLIIGGLLEMQKEPDEIDQPNKGEL